MSLKIEKQKAETIWAIWKKKKGGGVVPQLKEWTSPFKGENKQSPSGLAFIFQLLEEKPTQNNPRKGSSKCYFILCSWLLITRVTLLNLPSTFISKCSIL